MLWFGSASGRDYNHIKRNYPPQEFAKNPKSTAFVVGFSNIARDNQPPCQVAWQPNAAGISRTDSGEVVQVCRLDIADREVTHDRQDRQSNDDGMPSDVHRSLPPVRLVTQCAATSVRLCLLGHTITPECKCQLGTHLRIRIEDSLRRVDTGR